MTKIGRYLKIMIKTCTKCHIPKDISEFNKHHRDGYSGRCKFCIAVVWQENKHKYKPTHEKIIFRYLVHWLSFFIKIYSEFPKCQICGKSLKFVGTKNDFDVVNFDHKEESTIIKTSPNKWYRGRPCTKENKEIWTQHKFGILCRKCNLMIPTRNRKVWKNNICKYLEII